MPCLCTQRSEKPGPALWKGVRGVERGETAANRLLQDPCAMLCDDPKTLHDRSIIMVVKFGDREFRSKKAAETYVRGIVHDLGLCESVRLASVDTFARLCDVLSCHPRSCEKLRDLVDLRITRNAINPRAFEIRVVRSDGSNEDISWRACIHGKGNDPLSSAFRASVVDQILAFKRTADVSRCEMCNTTTNAATVHVDHVVHFATLTRDFVAESGLTPPSNFKDATRTNVKVFRECDRNFEDAWREYHKERALLRVLCCRCNLRRPNPSRRSHSNEEGHGHARCGTVQ